ncbi:nicotinamide/nicotinic acid mononucleotide adenylyltransferase 1 isoform X1 [Spodoptera frugiperda]|uniref:Nicotinamide/nicotinic acid mononucleotide adenylyltransferase 3 n=1 Tax=Spodoptera frugiperda TaxID=7108 RepID=A0A9R0DUY2_SPOFR|nr:nicotinamide/nicotinic acid mononucleotide adenylyltransferase 1 isoform X1 [Spodoptera frugiperda]
MSYGKIVIMACGSFSPPTYMHLRMFEIARDYIHTLNLGSVVGGLVCPVHDAYGKKDLVPAHHRISMLKLALRSSSWIKISEWETQQSGWTRTRVSLQYHQDTINNYLTGVNDPDPPSWLPDDILNLNSLDEPDNLMEKFNGNTQDGVTVKLLCGADLLESFATPGLWSDEDLETIVGRHGLVVVTRAGCDPGKFIYESDILYKHRKNVILVTNYIANEVSSTQIRRLVSRGESAKYLTDDGVLAYVRQHSLYGAPREHTEYTILNELIASYDKRSPQDVIMTSPEETSFKNILISIRDKPSIVDETITVKRPRKANFLMPNSHTDSVSPICEPLKPKMAYIDKVPSTYVPGKAVKIVSDATEHKLDKVTFDTAYSSLDSYLSKDSDFDLYKRRVSEGNVGKVEVETAKKRCSSTIRKLKPDEMKKSKSEVSKLCDKVKSIKIKESSGRNYKTRSCNDIVRLILTKHGIHVISDTEAIV